MFHVTNIFCDVIICFFSFLNFQVSFWLIYEYWMNIGRDMVSSLCQINLSTVAKQSLDCLFAEEGKHYTAMIGFSQQSNRQINANFTPHVFRTFSNQYFQSPMKRYRNFWSILWHFVVKYEH